MLTEKQNESSQNFDARIVHTVRNLKKLPSRSDNLPDVTELLQRENSISSPNEFSYKKANIESKKKKISIESSGHSTSDSNIQEPQLKDVDKNNSIKKLTKNSNSIVKAGSKQIKFSSNTLSSSLSFRNKSEYRKKLMNESSISKYKSMCISILKDDEEIRRLCESVNLISSSCLSSKENAELESFLEECFFSDHYFMYKLESLLESDVSKVKKVKFFKEELQSYLGLKMLDFQYENKLKSLDLAIENHLKNIETFNFFS